MPTLLLASVVIFLIMRAVPGDVALVVLGGSGESTHDVEQIERVREELGLNDPLVVQYGDWVWSLVNGDFGGRSLESRESIASIVGRQFPVTLLLTFYAIILSVVVSIPLGVIAAKTQDRWPDYLIRAVSVAGQSVPTFVLALLVLLGLVVVIEWSPPIIYADPWDDPIRHARIVFLPTVVLAVGLGAALLRITRGAMLEVLGQDFIRTARSKGLGERVVLIRHGLRVALLPVLTVSGLQVGALLGGAVVLESIFGLPGIGRGMVQAVTSRDYPVVQALAMLIVFLVLAINFFTDVLYVFIDPRISYRS